MIINDAGIAIIKKYESLQLKCYKDSGGKCSIGWGHTQDVKAADVIDVATAEKFLKEDIDVTETELHYYLGNALLNVNQWSALVCLVFNIGIGRFETSDLRHFLPYSKQRSADEFPKWDKQGGVVQKGLVSRRAEERALFLK